MVLTWVSGERTASTLNFLFSGVFIGETFLLSPIVTVVLSFSLRSRFFGGDFTFLFNMFFSGLCLLGDMDRLLVSSGTPNVCLDLDGDGLDLTGEEPGVLDSTLLIDFFKKLSFLVGNVSQVLLILSDLTGDFLGITATSFDSVISSFSILSSSAHSISCSIESI